jgi:hypothetical protein
MPGQDRDINGEWWPGGPTRVLRDMIGPDTWDANKWVWLARVKKVEATT